MRRAAVALAPFVAVVALLLGAPATGMAALTCTVNAADLEVFATSGSASTIVRNVNTIEVRDGNGAVACTNGPATVTTTDTVIVVDQSAGNFTTSSTVDLAGGAFAPGATDEPNTSDEVEFEFQSMERVDVEGSAGVENLRLGTAGVNLNAGAESGLFVTRDVDMTFGALEQLRVFAAGGNDIVDAQGGGVMGGPFALPVVLAGEADNDTLTGGDGADTIELPPALGNDTLSGGGGDDDLNADQGDDQVDGGPGTDRAIYTNASSAVTVDLAVAGPQATGGGGLDSLAAVENVRGSHHDDTLLGDAGANKLEGHDGGDLVDGRAGADELLGDTNGSASGDDTIMARDGATDSIMCFGGTDGVTADEAGVDTIDGNCENVDFAVPPPPAPPPPPAAALPPPPPPPAAAPDLSVVATLSRRSPQRVLRRRRLIVVARCPLEDCAAVVSGSIRVPRGRAVRLSTVRRSLGAGVGRRIVLTFSRRSARRLAAALRRRTRLRAAVQLRVTDAAGNRRLVRTTIRLRR